MKLYFAVLTTLVFMSSISSVKADFEPWLKGPCSSDFKKFCNDAPPGTLSVLECFKAHENELSAGCKAKREERMNARKSVDGVVAGDSAPPIVATKKDCAADVEKFCKPTANSESALGVMGRANPGARGCLRSHMAELSPACRAHFERGNAIREEMRKKLQDKKKASSSP